MIDFTTGDDCVVEGTRYIGIIEQGLGECGVVYMAVSTSTAHRVTQARDCGSEGQDDGGRNTHTRGADGMREDERETMKGMRDICRGAAGRLILISQLLLSLSAAAIFVPCES